MQLKTIGIIRVDEAYSKSEVLRRLSISQKFWDKLLDEGLRYTAIGHARWVTGQDLIKHLEKHSQTKPSEA